MTAHKTGYSWMTASIKLSWVNSCISLSLSFILDIKHRVRLDDCVLSTELDEWEWMKITVDLLIANWHFDLIYSDQSCTGSNIYPRRESSGLFTPRLSLPSFLHMINRFSHIIYWMIQKLPQTCTVILRIRIRKIAWFAVYICGNFWVTQYFYNNVFVI